MLLLLSFCFELANQAILEEKHEAEAGEKCDLITVGTKSYPQTH